MLLGNRQFRVFEGIWCVDSRIAGMCYSSGTSSSRHHIRSVSALSMNEFIFVTMSFTAKLSNPTFFCFFLNDVKGPVILYVEVEGRENYVNEYY